MLGLVLGLALAASPGARWLGPKPPPQPARVATLAPSLTEMVVALGAGARLVAVSRYDELPQVSKLPRLGGLMDPSAEAILAARPDLLVVQPSPTIEPILKKLAELGVSVLELSLTNVAEVELAERQLGAALGDAAAGEALAAKLDAAVAATRARAAKLPHPRVLLVYGWSPLVVAGPGSFADQLLRAAGGLNAATATANRYATYSIEEAAISHPDLILDLATYEKMPEAFAKLPGLAKAKRVRLASPALMHPGPGLVNGLAELFAVIHGMRDGG